MVPYKKIDNQALNAIHEFLRVNDTKSVNLSKLWHDLLRGFKNRQKNTSILKKATLYMKSE